MFREGMNGTGPGRTHRLFRDRGLACTNWDGFAPVVDVPSIELIVCRSRVGCTPLFVGGVMGSRSRHRHASTSLVVV